MIDAYRTETAETGNLGFAETAAIAGEMASRGDAQIDHLLVDESQDLSPSHWRMLRALTLNGPDDIFLAEDTHQRIYARTSGLKQAGLKFGRRTDKLDLSYRTTAETLRWGMAVLDGGEFTDLEGEPESHAYRAVRSGVSPRLLQFPTSTAEENAVVDIVRGWIDDGVKPRDIAVLARTQWLVERFEASLDRAGIDRAVGTDDGVLVTTIYQAKGAEYPRVVLASVGRQQNPVLRNGMAESTQPESVLLLERSLVYVAATRARDALVVTYTGVAHPNVPTKDWGTGLSTSADDEVHPWRLSPVQDRPLTVPWARRTHERSSLSRSVWKFHADRPEGV